MEIEITYLQKGYFYDTANLIMKYYKEYKNEIIHRVEAENILKNKDNITKIAINKVNKVIGCYVYQKTDENYFIHVFILDPIVRKTKQGYLIWKHMNQEMKDKPAIISVIRKNLPITSLIAKRGHKIGTYLSLDGETIDYYNLTFKESK